MVQCLLIISTFSQNFILVQEQFTQFVRWLRMSLQKHFFPSDWFTRDYNSWQPLRTTKNFLKLIRSSTRKKKLEWFASSYTAVLFPREISIKPYNLSPIRWRSFFFRLVLSHNRKTGDLVSLSGCKTAGLKLTFTCVCCTSLFQKGKSSATVYVS